ncbi:hypothetical protein BH09MYX1_BH09MYX1_15650 [soil metagenome]
MGLFAIVFSAQVAHAEPFAKGPDWDGTSDFYEMAKDAAGADVVTTLDFGALHKEDAVVIIHPDRPLDVESLSKFMREGGRVVLFDDFGTGDQLLAHFEIKRVALPDKPQLMLRQNPALAIAVPAADHPAVAGVDRVVSNHATGLFHKELSPVLRVRDENGGDGVLLALAGAVGKGRLLAVGDSSIVINSMLRYPGNRLFVRNVLNYALEDDADVGKRHGKLYVVSGSFPTRGTFGDPASSGGAFDAFRHLREFLRDVDHDGIPPLAAFLLAAAVGLSIVLWISSRAARTHQAIIPRYTRAASVSAQGGVAGHAAVLAAKGTTRALGILEWKSAIEEELCARLDLARTPAPKELVRAASEAKILSTESARDLLALLVRMSEVETMVLARRSEAMRRVKDSDLVDVSHQARKILASLE